MNAFIDTEIVYEGRKCIRRHFASIQACQRAAKQNSAHVIAAFSTVLIMEGIDTSAYEANTEERPETLILLAGGRSLRMGKDKAFMDYFGTTMLEFQTETARLCGFQKILISSGNKAIHIAQIRSIPDDIPDHGPVGGIASCMSRAETPRCVVMPVDVPLLPAELLIQLAERSKNSPVTVVRHAGKIEPLISCWDTTLSGRIKDLIRKECMSVKDIFEYTGVDYFDCSFPDHIFANLNTPEEFNSAIKAVPDFE